MAESSHLQNQARRNQLGRSGHGPTKLFDNPIYILLDLSLLPECWSIWLAAVRLHGLQRNSSDLIICFSCMSTRIWRKTCLALKWRSRLWVIQSTGAKFSLVGGLSASCVVKKLHVRGQRVEWNRTISTITRLVVRNFKTCLRFLDGVAVVMNRRKCIRPSNVLV